MLPCMAAFLSPRGGTCPLPHLALSTCTDAHGSDHDTSNTHPNRTPCLHRVLADLLSNRQTIAFGFSSNAFSCALSRKLSHVDSPMQFRKRISHISCLRKLQTVSEWNKDLYSQPQLRVNYLYDCLNWTKRIQLFFP